VQSHAKRSLPLFRDRFVAAGGGGPTKAHYDHIRTNITYSRLNSRGRVQIAPELPLLYTAGRWPTPPEVKYPAEDAGDKPRRNRQSRIEPEQRA
jgi:hypothetical protein